MPKNLSGLFHREVATKDGVTHQHECPAFELLLGITLAAEEYPELVGDRRPIQLKYGAVRDPLDPEKLGQSTSLIAAKQRTLGKKSWPPAESVGLRAENCN